MPPLATMCAGYAALCLGIAQAQSNTLLELGSSKIQLGSVSWLRDRPAVQGDGGVHCCEARRLSPTRGTSPQRCGDIASATVRYTDFYLKRYVIRPRVRS